MDSKLMEKLLLNPNRLTFFSIFTLLAFLLFPFQALATDTFNFVVPPTSAYAGVTYQVNSAVTFNVQALNGASVDNSFNDVVTVGLYNTATSQLADPQAVFVPSGYAPVVGATAPMTFQNGLLNFGVTLTAGCNSMQVSIQDASVTASTATYPGAIGNTSGPGYVVEGFFQSYFLAASSGTTIPAQYPPNTDLLLTSPVTNSNYAVTVISGSSVTNSLCFAVTGVTGGYAGLNAGVAAHFEAFKDVNATAAVSYEVILDYNGTLADYNNPDLTPGDPNEDTVYFGSVPNIAESYSLVSGFSSTTGAAPATYMNNGQVIVRFWTSAPVTNTVNLQWSSNEGILSYINVPYSNSNVQPVTAGMSPSIIEDSVSTPVTYTINNQYSLPITYLTIQIPTNNPSGSGTPFSVSVPSSVPGLPGSSLGVSQATNTTTGAITLISASNPITVNQVVQIPLTITCSSQTNSAWDFPLLSVLSNTGLAVPSVSGGAVIASEAPPPAPSSFTASVIPYINSGGGSVSLNWSQVTAQTNLGYVLSRSPTPATGAFSASVTLPNGTIVPNAVTFTPNTTLGYIDSAVTNLTAYTYNLTAYNAVAQSTPVTTASATPYANPGPPSSVQALTGGTTIELNWATPVAVPGSYPVTGYQIYRGTSSGGKAGLPSPKWG